MHERLYFHFRSKIWRHRRVPRPLFERAINEVSVNETAKLAMRSSADVVVPRCCRRWRKWVAEKVIFVRRGAFPAVLISGAEQRGGQVLTCEEPTMVTLQPVMITCEPMVSVTFCRCPSRRPQPCLIPRRSTIVLGHTSSPSGSNGLQQLQQTTSTA